MDFSKKILEQCFSTLSNQVGFESKSKNKNKTNNKNNAQWKEYIAVNHIIVYS